MSCPFNEKLKIKHKKKTTLFSLVNSVSAKIGKSVFYKCYPLSFATGEKHIRKTFDEACLAVDI